MSSNSTGQEETPKEGSSALGDEDRILEVVAVPRHERDEHVAAERELAELGRGAVGDDVAGLDPSPTFTSGRWVMQVFWFERWNFSRL